MGEYENIISFLKKMSAKKIREKDEATETTTETVAPRAQGFGFIIQSNVQFKGRIWRVGEKIKASELGDKVEEFKKRGIIK